MIKLEFLSLFPTLHLHPTSLNQNASTLTWRLTPASLLLINLFTPRSRSHFFSIFLTLFPFLLLLLLSDDFYPSRYTRHSLLLQQRQTTFMVRIHFETLHPFTSRTSTRNHHCQTRRRLQSRYWFFTICEFRRTRIRRCYEKE